MSLRYRLRDGLGEYVLLGLHELLPEGHEPVVLGGLWQAERRLRSLAADPFNLRVLRNVVSTHASAYPFGPLSTEQLVRQAASLLGCGTLRLVRSPPETMPVGLLLSSKKETAPAPPAPIREKQSLMLQVVDDVTDEPIANVKLRIKLPDGTLQQAVTDASGNIRVSNVPQGVAQVASALGGATLAETLTFVKSGALSSQKGANPGRRRRTASGRFLARVTEHKVNDGETLASIAGAHGLTVDQLTQFNWGTTQPDKVQRHLFVDVGCSTKGSDGKFVLTSHDDPGILYVARPLEMSGLALEERHILRVAKPTAAPTFLFSA